MAQNTRLEDASCGAALCHAADSILAQCESILLEVPDAAYTAPAETIRGGTLGKHLRHTLDHFAAACADCAVIDYDHRERDVPMETDRRAALAAVASLRERLAASTTRDSAGSVRVRVMVAGDGAEVELLSTFGRELAFATHHAVHHIAMMKAIAGEFGLELGDGVGKAPSTIHHERRPR